MGYTWKCVSHYSHNSFFYSYKFLNIGIHEKYVNKKTPSSFLQLQILKYEYTSKICVLLFTQFLFLVPNFEIWVYVENMCLFIHIVPFFSYKLSNMGIHRKYVSYYSHSSFLQLQFFKILVYIKNMCLVIHIVPFFSYKF